MHLLHGRIKSWAVVETPSMAAAGRKLFQDDRLKFFEDPRAAVAGIESPDLILAQGVLQYTESPLRMLDNLLGLGFKYIYVTRTAVTVGADEREGPIFTKQITTLAAHGPGALPPDLKNHRTTQPLVLVPCEALAARVLPGYRLLFRFDESEEGSVLIGSKTVTIKDVGFLAVKEDV
jgi:putative methyltransferase (TIGR04325 family)